VKLAKKIIPGFILRIYRDYRKKKQIKPYRGNNVFCPLCNSKFAKFAPFGLVKRENAKCPNCGSLERHRLLWKYLNEKTSLFSDIKLRLLHFAPEWAFYQIFSQDHNIEYVPCDLLPEKYAYGGNVKIAMVDITNIPFAENYFDVVLCNHVLEHVPDDKLAMSELYRVMKKGAWGIFQVPMDDKRDRTYEDFSISTPEGREKAFGQNDHVRCYGKDYKERLVKVGFDVTEDDYAKSFASDELFKYGFRGSEIIYYCRK
jgi:SAM-dependent methyltransferase